MCPLQSCWTMVTSWSWMVQCNRSMHIARCLGCRVLGLIRRVTQHAASCPLAGVVGCVLPSCVQGLAEPSSRRLRDGENRWILLWSLVFLVSILVFYLLVSTRINIRRRLRHSRQRPSHLTVHFPSQGSCPLGWGKALATVTTLPFSKKKAFLFHRWSFQVVKRCSFYRSMVYFCGVCC